MRRRTLPFPVQLLALSALVLAACRDDSPAGPGGREDVTGDTLAAPASLLASAAMSRISYEPRPQDFSVNHPALPGFPISHNTLLVSLEPGATVGSVNGLLKTLNADIVGSIPGVRDESPSILFLRLPSGTHEAMEAVLTTLRGSPAVRSAVQDARVGAEVTPSPAGAATGWSWELPPAGGNWGMEVVRAPQLWNLKDGIDKAMASSLTTAGTVGFLDTGFGSHPDVPITTLNSDTDWHGVAVAGVVGARWGNGQGVDGIDPYATLVGIATAGGVNGLASWGDHLVDELNALVVANTPRVINVSLGFNWQSAYGINANGDPAAQRIATDAGALVRDALGILSAEGVDLPVIVAAAGNGSNVSGMPVQAAVYSSPMTNAALDHGAANIIVVEATDDTDSRASFSDVGGHVSAPGVNILMASTPHTHPGGTNHPNPYEVHSGTSFAAPLVAGLVSYLYTLSPDLPAPTLSTNPARDVVVNTGAPATGARNRVDAFSAALDLDRLQQRDRVLRMLVDLDDGSPDGNLRIDPKTSAVVAGLDLDGDQGAGDGRVDMSDFRVWRDAYLLTSQPAGFVLDGAATHPKKDLNRNGVWDPINDDFYFARADFNGDAVVDLGGKTFVAGAVGAEATDLEVLGAVFVDPHYSPSDLPGLVISGDVAINPETILGYPEAVSVRSYVYRADDGALLHQRLHTGSFPGEERYQVYTLPAQAPDNEYKLRLEVFDDMGDVGFVDTLTVTVSPGEDLYWDPECIVGRDGSPTGGTGRGSICSDAKIAPDFTIVFGGGNALFTPTVTGVTDPGVTWRVGTGPRFGTVSAGGLYTAPTLSPGQSFMDSVWVTSVEDPTAMDWAAVWVVQPRINPRDPNEGGCRPSETRECSGEGSSWGDPHLVTPDDRKYDFMAVGDFVLTKSTAPDDDFEIHSRYGRPPEDKEFSWNNAVAMRVEGDVVELYAGDPGVIDIVVNGEDVTVPLDESLELDGGGVIARTLGYITVSWPDRTQVEVMASGVPGVLSYARTSLPSSRYGQVEGLLGNFDGDPDNDIRIRNGAVLTDPTLPELYSTYRQSWWVPFGTAASLFTRGVEQFDATFPPRVISVFDLPDDEVVRASQVCIDAGVLDADILNACILDVVLTGDDRWAAVAAGMDPNTPGIKISPAVAYLQQGDSRQFGAILSGTADRRVQWTATGGSIRVDGDNIMTYTAPDQTGEYTLTATSLADGSLVATATVHVSEAMTGYSKEWNGQVSRDWGIAENWTPAGVPDSTDNVYIPAGTPNNLYWGYDYPVVNNVLIEANAASGGLRNFVVRGNAILDTRIEVWMTGIGKTVRGRVGNLRVEGQVSAAGPLEVSNLYLMDQGTFSPGGQRVDVTQSLFGQGAGGGRLVMNRPEDHLVVARDLNVASMKSGLGSLTDGTLEVKGRLSFSEYGTFKASGGHRLVLNGDQPQIIDAPWSYVGRQNEPLTYLALNHVAVANPAGVILGYETGIPVNGLITVTAGTVTASEGWVYLAGALSNPADGWRVPVVVGSPNAELPPHLKAPLRLYGGAHAVDYTLPADLEVTGPVEVRTGSNLRVGAHGLTVNGTLTTVGNGNVVLDDDAGLLVVNGDAVFGQGATVDVTAGALFSAGRFEITGNLTENFNRFRASGTHVTAFTGTAAQTVSMSCYYNNCAPYNAAAAAPMQEIEVSNPAGVTFQGRAMGISGEVRVLQGGAAVFDQNVRLDRSLDLAGTLTLNTGRTLAVTETLLLRSTGVLNNDGTMTTGSCTKEDGGTVNGTDPCS